MYAQAFADAARPKPHRVLRVPLLAYSLGHELLLHRGRNALLESSEEFDKLAPEAQRTALIEAVLICSRTWIENTKPSRNLWLWSWFLRSENFDEAVATFRAYRHEGTTMPPLVQAGEDVNSQLEQPGSPLLAQLSDYTTERFGLAAYDQPMGMLLWMFYARMELDRRCEVKNALQNQIDAEMAQHMADYKREQEEKKKCQP